GGAFLAVTFDLIQLRQLWGLLLVAGGAWLVLGPAHWCRHPRSTSAHPVDVATLNTFAMLGGVTRGTNSTAFRSGAASAFMGGCVIDLRKAKLAGSEAVFDSFAVWGGVEIKVPEDWAVENRGLALLGGFVDSTRRPSEPRGRLILTGLAIMGGVEVKN
ncbi:MAG TPA: LiaF domain-containing protein, partial [Solirubrobacterales bacterium]|nr:LiaF domain-containing protein [Solirubrobacterales bacterium]